MSQQVSPFLHRDTKSARERVEHRKQSYAERIVPSPEAQRLKIEMYRYRWYQRNGTLGQTMQHIGDCGRKYALWLLIPFAMWMVKYVVGRLPW